MSPEARFCKKLKSFSVRWKVGVVILSMGKHACARGDHIDTHVNPYSYSCKGPSTDSRPFV